MRQDWMHAHSVFSKTKKKESELFSLIFSLYLLTVKNKWSVLAGRDWRTQTV